MSNRKWRERFLSDSGRYGIRYEDACKLLRFATTLQRLAEAQCNGEYPYANGAEWSRAVPEYRRKRDLASCERCDDEGATETWARSSMTRGTMCPNTTRVKGPCTGGTQCPLCDGRGHMLVCPDCRTTERARAFVAQLDTGCTYEDCNSIQACPHGTWKAEFQGDPRGAVFSIVRADGVRLAVEC